MFHQRFSTNTVPRWPLAQPFRDPAHNGEINTITVTANGRVRVPIIQMLLSLIPALRSAIRSTKTGF
ncbi:hypothetical protein ACLK1S_19980 [Escherichia coli]